MLKGLRVSEQFEYISERDSAKSEEEGATIFVIGTLPVDLRTRIQDGVMAFDQANGASNEAAFRMNINRQHLEAVRFGLKEARNFADADGKVIKFESSKKTMFGKEYEVPTDSFLSHMPTWLIAELGKVIMGANSVTETERKNSKKR